MKNILTLLTLLIISFHAFTQTTISTPGMFFDPDSITVNVGDTVIFALGGNHNAVEVSDSTWITGGNTPLAGGFNFPFGMTGQFIPQIAQTYYYVCQPHAMMGMKGVIVVQSINIDCNGIANGTSILDDCGDCQQAYIYDYVTHAVTLLDDTINVVLGATEMLVMPDNPSNPYWNAGCVFDCNGVANGTSVMDSCGVCQQAYIYDYVTHAVTLLDDTINVVLGATEMLILADDPSNPYWNSSCVDCNGVANGTALIDTCGICHQAYIYDYVTHDVTFLDDTINVVLGATEILVLPDDPSNPYWNDCDSTTTNTINIIEPKNRNLVRIVDVLGRDGDNKKNQVLFFIFDDGTIEKKYIIR